MAPKIKLSRAGKTAEQEREEADEAREEAEREEAEAKEAEAEQEEAEQEEAEAEAQADEGAVLVEREPLPPRRLRATKFDLVCPYSNVRVTVAEATKEKVPVSVWLQSQIDAGYVEVVEE